MFRTHQNTGRLAILFLALISLWQIMVLHHMLITPHSPDTATRQSAILAASEDLNAQGTETDSTPRNHSHNRKSSRPHHCPFLDSITDIPGFVTPVVLSPVLPCKFFLAEVAVPYHVFSPQQSILDYAPGTSPPLLSYV